MHWIMSSRARIRLALVVIVGGLLLGMLLIMKMSGKTSPTNTQDYDTVVQLIHEGQLKLSDKEGMVRLPSGYSYLSLNGSISVASSVDTAPTRVVFFTRSIDKSANRIEGYLYKENDVSPRTVDFPGLPYADSYHCDRLKPHWFSCTYYFH